MPAFLAETSRSVSLAASRIAGLVPGPLRELGTAAFEGARGVLGLAASTDLRAEEAARNAALLEIVREMNRSLALPELLAGMCRTTVEAFGVQQATVFFYHPRFGAVIPIADHGSPPHIYERFVSSRYTFTNTPHADEIVAGRTVVVSRALSPTPDDLTLLDLSELHTLAMLPLPADGESRSPGTFIVGIAEAREFTPDQIRGLEVVAHHAGTAIARGRALRAEKKAAQFRAAVSSLAIELNRESNQPQALQVLCARSREMFGASSVALLAPTDGQLRPVASDGDPATRWCEPVPLALPDHPVVRAFLDATVTLENKIRTPFHGVPEGVRSLLAIPLAGPDGVTAVLILADKARRRFDPRMADEEAAVLGTLAAAVLHNLDLLGRLHRVSALKDRFLANVSHDLRTPLNVILGYGQLALEGTFGELTAPLADTLRRMTASAREQLSLVEDLFDLSRIELDRLVVRRDVVAVAPLLEGIQFAAAPMLRDRPVQVTVRPPDPTLVVHADRDRVRQILINLLSNAVKFTPQGTIEVWTVATADEVHIAVRDSGIGIAPADQAAIFDPFQQVDGERAALGAGLGLAISQRLAVLMGGTLTVESALGCGSTFWLSLPSGAETERAPTTATRTIDCEPGGESTAVPDDELHAAVELGAHLPH